MYHGKKKVLLLIIALGALLVALLQSNVLASDWQKSSHKEEIASNYQNVPSNGNIILAEGEVETDRSYFEQGLSNFNSRNYTQAIVELNKGIEVLPDSPEYDRDRSYATLVIARSYYELKDYEKALAHLNKAATFFQNAGDDQANKVILKLRNGINRHTKGQKSVTPLLYFVVLKIGLVLFTRWHNFKSPQRLSEL